MNRVETIEDFYKRKFDWMPDNIRNGIGHFNVFTLDPFVGDKAQPVPYKRRDYFKIMLVTGNSQVHFADKVVEVQKQALSFSSPQIPYKWEHLDHIRKMQPTANFDRHQINASQRISALFLELLERQFPIDDSHQSIQLRSASDFAKQLNIHVNHLNRAVKEITEKTTSQIIAERIVQESKILLKHSPWNVSEISYALGFTEVTHFNNFFKKHVQLSPLKFRNV